MKLVFLLITIFLFLSNANAQHTGKISGAIVKAEQPVDGATVMLLRAKDSSTIKLEVSGKDGLFIFNDIANEKYLVR